MRRKTPLERALEKARSERVARCVEWATERELAILQEAMERKNTAVAEELTERLQQGAYDDEPRPPARDEPRGATVLGCFWEPLKHRLAIRRQLANPQRLDPVVAAPLAFLELEGPGTAPVPSDGEKVTGSQTAASETVIDLATERERRSQPPAELAWRSQREGARTESLAEKEF